MEEWKSWGVGEWGERENGGVGEAGSGRGGEWGRRDSNRVFAGEDFGGWEWRAGEDGCTDLHGDDRAGGGAGAGGGLVGFAVGPTSGHPSLAGPGEAVLHGRPSRAVGRFPGALAGSATLLMGQVVGDLSAFPQTLALGPIPCGMDTTRQILLSGAQASSLQELKAVSEASWLQAKLDPLQTVVRPGSGGQASSSTRILEVTVHPQRAGGILETSLKITLANGQRLVIPVNAYPVLRKGPPSGAGGVP